MRAFREESGFTLVELLMTMATSLVVMSAIVVMLTTSLRNQDRINKRVDANQRVRPVMTHIIQELHSACIAPRMTPIIGDGSASGPSASTGTQISFLSKSGSTVTPTPEKHVITLSGGTLSESVYQATGGAQPGPWTFSPTGTTTQLLTQVTAPATGMFQYYDFVNGQVDTAATAVPVTATDAAKVAIVKITISSSPTKGVSTFDPASPLVVSNSADLRLENAGQFPNQDNLPCV